MGPDNYYLSIETLVRKKEIDRGYQSRGFHLWEFNEDIADSLYGFFKNQKIYDINDCHPEYYPVNFDRPQEVANLLNSNFEFFAPPLLDTPGNPWDINRVTDLSVLKLEELLSTISKDVEFLLGHSFRVVNIRATNSKKLLLTMAPHNGI